MSISLLDAKRVHPDEFSYKLDILSPAVSLLFNNPHLGTYVRQIIDADYETSDEVLADLEHLDDSDIMQIASHCDQWNETNNVKKLHDLLLRIFRDNVTSLAILVSVQLPNTLEDCTVHHILYVATCVMKTLNKTAQRKLINPQAVNKLVTSELIDGLYMKKTKRLDFIAKARAYNIPAGKSRQLCEGIQEYDFIHNAVRVRPRHQHIFHQQLCEGIQESKSRQILQIIDNVLTDLNNDNEPEEKWIFDEETAVSNEPRYELLGYLFSHCAPPETENTRVKTKSRSSLEHDPVNDKQNLITIDEEWNWSENDTPRKNTPMIFPPARSMNMNKHDYDYEYEYMHHEQSVQERQEGGHDRHALYRNITRIDMLETTEDDSESDKERVIADMANDYNKSDRVGQKEESVSTYGTYRDEFEETESVSSVDSEALRASW
eukprot:34442_1